MNWVNIPRVSHPTKVKLFIENDDKTWTEYLGELNSLSIQDDIIDSMRYVAEFLGQMPVPTKHTLSADINIQGVRQISTAIDADDYAAWEQMVLYGVQ